MKRIKIFIYSHSEDLKDMQNIYIKNYHRLVRLNFFKKKKKKNEEEDTRLRKRMINTTVASDLRVPSKPLVTCFSIVHVMSTMRRKIGSLFLVLLVVAFLFF